MKKKSLLFAVAFLYTIIGIQAQTDVTSQYITNPGFEDCEAVEITECYGYGTTVLGEGYSLIANHATAAGFDYAEQGWQLVSQNTNANGGVVGYGGKVQYSKSGFEDVPANGPTETSGSKALCFCGNNNLVYQQTWSILFGAPMLLLMGFAPQSTTNALITMGVMVVMFFVLNGLALLRAKKRAGKK